MKNIFFLNHFFLISTFFKRNFLIQQKRTVPGNMYPLSDTYSAKTVLSYDSIYS